MEKKIEFYMTAGIAADMDSDQNFACEIGTIIHRFICNDWGDLCSDDAPENPKVTTILYASEY